MPTYYCSECEEEFFDRSEMAEMSPCQLCGGEDSVSRADDEPAVPELQRPAPDPGAEPRKAAAELLEELEISEPPIDVEAIAQRLGLTVSVEVLGNVDGEIRDKKIRVNSAHHSVRQRFTIAHELGHLRMHTTHGERGSEVERQANEFAGALLLPPAMLSKAVREGLNSEELRRHFRVSRDALSIALDKGKLTARLTGS
jgi:hypothetical protein